LEKYVTVVNSDLPNRDELQIVLNNVLESCHKNIDENLKKKLIDSALGMTVMEADLAFCLAAVKSNFDESAPAIIPFLLFVCKAIVFSV
jgi:hypothetical protein